MDTIAQNLLVAIVRESVSLAVLLVFGWFAYSLGKEFLEFLRDWGGEMLEVLRQIAENKRD